MPSAWDCFAFLSCSAMMMAVQCKAGDLPPPTHLTYEWLDAFTVNVSWKKPSGQCSFYWIKDGASDRPLCTTWSNFTNTLLTEEMRRDNHWTYNIMTVSHLCDGSNKSAPVSISIFTHKPRAELVKDFKCFTYPEERNCSWIPVNPSLNLTLSYRLCGYTSESIKGLKVCERPYSSGTRNGCFFKVAFPDEICIFVDSEVGMSTFKPVLVVPSPQLSITEEEDSLKLNWTPPEVGEQCVWNYEVKYKRCNEPNEITVNVRVENEHTALVAYDKSCHYEFQSRVETNTKFCGRVFSDFCEVVTYGTNEPHDGTLTVVAIVIPMILSACVILSCYCFRRHIAIICPVIPDPSTIFKEMMMNKELKSTTGSLYTPVPEPIDSCKISLVSENAVPQQNS